MAPIEEEIIDLSSKLEMDAMSEPLTRPRAKYFRQVFKSSQNVKIRWKDYRETADLQ